MKPLTGSLLCLGLLMACAPAAPPGMPEPSPAANPYAPRPGDAALARGAVFIDSAQVLVMESYPIQISVGLDGNLPTPCHELRAIVPAPDSSNRIAIEVYTVVDPNLACIQVLRPFGAVLPLGTFPPGHYIVKINGEVVGEFDV
jgi:hypothetical protein